jgi:hypothetical protein
LIQLRTAAARVIHPETLLDRQAAAIGLFSTQCQKAPWRPGCSGNTWRPIMISPTRYPMADMYRVEVSGWDKNECFFVEKSELEWSEECGKQICLRRAIPNGAVIFLRLLPFLGSERSDPVPYETEFVARTPDGHHQFRLHQVSPRTRASNESVN